MCVCCVCEGVRVCVCVCVRVCGWWKSFLSVVGEESGTGQVQDLMTTNVLTHYTCTCNTLCMYMYMHKVHVPSLVHCLGQR